MANPKSAAFVAGFFATVLPVDAPTWLFVATATTLAGVSAYWSFSLALLLSTGRARSVYLRAKRGINAVLGAVMLGFGARLALSR